jgi:hypothetical protein
MQVQSHFTRIGGVYSIISQPLVSPLGGRRIDLFLFLFLLLLNPLNPPPRSLAEVQPVCVKQEFMKFL